MAEELLLYTEIQDWTVSEMIDEINEYADEAIKLRINCTGGDPIAVYGLCAKIQEYADQKGMICEANQVKTKFGGLRFYVTYTDSYIKGLLSMAEMMSLIIKE